MDICFAINKEYVQHLSVAITSIIVNNADSPLEFHVLSKDLTDSDRAVLLRTCRHKQVKINFHKVDDRMFADLKLNISHISRETYYRYILPELLPDVSKALYLDADVIVKGSLREIWSLDINNYYMAGVFDTYISDIGYKGKVGFHNDDLYVNAGVLLFNLEKIRKDNKVEELFRNTRELASDVEYQDQDILNITFKGKILRLDQKYNYTFRDVVSNTKKELRDSVIVHFTGDRKPWDYFFATTNPAEVYYYIYLLRSPFKRVFFQWFCTYPNFRHFVARVVKGVGRRVIRFFSKPKVSLPVKKDKEKIKVALLVDEFFGGAGTAFGGYGFLARHYIAKYIPNENIQLDVLLSFASKLECVKVDETNVYRLPKNEKLAKQWLDQQGYDVFLSIELTSSSYQILKLDEQKHRLVLWIQDPRPWYEWREINTVKLFPETCYWDTPVYEYVNFLNWKCMVRYITQGYFLIPKALDLYRLNNDVYMEYLPNPIDYDPDFDVKTYKKKDQIIFLGRIESVKRGWLFCEIAALMPEYEFYLLGQTFREKGKNSAIIEKYKDLPNLHFAGHVEGEVKERFLKESKILVNTSIHEALPISFLEALSYGTLIVSNRNPEELTSKFGEWVGEVYGDGFDKVHLYVGAIRRIMKDDEERSKKAETAVRYIREVHNTKNFVSKLRQVLFEEARR